MRRLSKRWGAVMRVNRGSLYRMFLSEFPAKNTDLCWACIEFKDPKGPFQLEIWDGTEEEEWKAVAQFSTLKQAKTVGRLLAGVALAQAKF